MKTTILFVVLCVTLVGCANAPVRVRVRNCQAIGAGLYDCEEIPADVNASRPGKV